MKNLLLLILFVLVVWYAYVTVAERQKQRLVRERRPKIQEMFDKYEFRRALYQIRQTRERMQQEDQATEVESPAPLPPEEDRPKDSPLSDDIDYLDKLKSEPATVAQPIQPIQTIQAPAEDQPAEERPAQPPVERRKLLRGRFAPSDGAQQEQLPVDQGDAYQRPPQYDMPEQPQQPAQPQTQQPPTPQLPNE